MAPRRLRPTRLLPHHALGHPRRNPNRHRLPNHPRLLLRQHPRNAPQMTEPSTNQTAFDQFAGDYDTALAQGLSVSGEDKMYFARGRVDWTKRILDKLGEKPATIMDFGCGTGTSIPLFLEWPGIVQVIGTEVSAKSLDVAIAKLASARVQFHLM